MKINSLFHIIFKTGYIKIDTVTSCERVKRSKLEERARPQAEPTRERRKDDGGWKVGGKERVGAVGVNVGTPNVGPNGRLERSREPHQPLDISDPNLRGS